MIHGKQSLEKQREEECEAVIFFPYRGQNDRNEIKLTCNRGFRWMAGSTPNDSIRRPGVLADLDPLNLEPPAQIR